MEIALIVIASAGLAATVIVNVVGRIGLRWKVLRRSDNSVQFFGVIDDAVGIVVYPVGVIGDGDDAGGVVINEESARGVRLDDSIGAQEDALNQELAGVRVLVGPRAGQAGAVSDARQQANPIERVGDNSEGSAALQGMFTIYIEGRPVPLLPLQAAQGVAVPGFGGAARGEEDSHGHDTPQGQGKEEG